ncbi:Pre-mRNA-splicing factor ATP-dependent RNA helicase-like protein PRP2, partial [Dictyocoela roeselum]
MLPLESHKTKILDHLKSPRPLLITAPTGSGKSTYIPCLLASAFPISSILIVEPRRIAVTSLYGYLKNRIDVGFKMRFRGENCLARVLVVTDGMALNLLGRGLHDFKNKIKKFNHAVRKGGVEKENKCETVEKLASCLNESKNYDFVILDEIHERNVRLDILLGLLKNRKHTKLILMSATPDCRKISEYVQCDVLDIRVDGYPLTLVYEEAAVSDYIHACFMKIRSIVREKIGADNDANRNNNGREVNVRRCTQESEDIQK